MTIATIASTWVRRTCDERPEDVWRWRREAAAAKPRGGPAQQGKDGQRRPMFRRRKVCKFCSDKIDDINYKDVKLLMPFVPERAKILPRRISGTCAHAPAEAAHRAHARAPAGAHPVHRRE